jgi:hypothetical protein
MGESLDEASEQPLEVDPLGRREMLEHRRHRRGSTFEDAAGCREALAGERKRLRACVPARASFHEAGGDQPVNQPPGAGL